MNPTTNFKKGIALACLFAVFFVGILPIVTFAELPLEHGSLLVPRDAISSSINAVPDSMTSPGFTFSSGKDLFSSSTKATYMSTSFFENAYIIELNWNVESDRYPAVKTVSVNDKVYPVAFSTGTKEHSENKGVLEAARLAIATILTKEDWLPLRAPVITKVAGPFRESADALAERFRTKNNLSYFGAVIVKSSPITQTRELDSAYHKNRVDFFAAAAVGLTPQERVNYAQKAYDDNRLDFFSLLMDSLSPSQQSSYAQKAYNDKQIDFFSVLSDVLSPSQRGVYASRAYDEERIDFFSVLSDSLTDTQRNTFAKKAYQEERLPFFTLLCSSLTPGQLSTMAEQAYEDNRLLYFSVISDFLPLQERAAFRTRASGDRKTDFWFELDPEEFFR